MVVGVSGMVLWVGDDDLDGRRIRVTGDGRLDACEAAWRAQRTASRSLSL